MHVMHVGRYKKRLNVVLGVNYITRTVTTVLYHGRFRTMQAGLSWVSFSLLMFSAVYLNVASARLSSKTEICQIPYDTASAP